MGFDLNEVLASHKGENFQLYGRYINPQLVKVLRSIGFDRFYSRAEGAYLFDDEGRRYLDFLSGFGVFALGRSHPAIKKALHEAIDADLPNLIQMDAALLPGVLASEVLKRCHPGMGRVFFTNSGAEAIESALKFSRHATGRSRVLFCEHGFHGLTLGALSANGGQEFRRGFGPFLPGFTQVPFGDAEALERESNPAMSPPSSSSRSRATVSTSRLWSTGAPSRSCVVVTGPCSSPTRCRPASAVPAGSGPTSTTASSPTS